MYDSIEEALSIIIRPKIKKIIVTINNGLSNLVLYILITILLYYYNKNKEKYIRVIVDAENYRAKREKTLEQLANRLADKVIKTRKSVRLEPMNPYERKVIHATLQSNPGIITRSEGEEPYRRVIIELKR